MIDCASPRHRPAADDEPEDVAVLRAIWTARGQDAPDVLAEIGSGTGTVCRRLKDVGSGPVDDDQRVAWRSLLAREGKLGETTVGELVARHGPRETGPRP
jgi:hypothetical protein